MTDYSSPADNPQRVAARATIESDPQFGKDFLTRYRGEIEAFFAQGEAQFRDPAADALIIAHLVRSSHFDEEMQRRNIERGYAVDPATLAPDVRERLAAEGVRTDEAADWIARWADR